MKKKPFSINLEDAMRTPSAHWACIGGLGGGDDPSLKEFDYNHKTEKQVFM